MMTIEEFDKIKWGSHMCAIYDNAVYKVISVSFAEKLIEISNLDGFDEGFWVRCENVELV